MNISVINPYTYIRNTHSKSKKKNYFVNNKRLVIPSKNTGKNIFGFSSVCITDKMVMAKYGNTQRPIKKVVAHTAGSKSPSEYTEPDSEKVKAVKLPESFNKLKDNGFCYYHGRKVNEYEMVQIAVAAGKLEIPEEIKRNSESQYARKAFDMLVKEPAVAKYSWSNTLYSEDGYYTFTKTADGRTKMNVIDDTIGASVEDIANMMMSGTPNRNIERRYLEYLRRVDPDLYKVVSHIGGEVRNNGLMEDLYGQGLISERQNHYDMGLLGMMFGKNSDDMRCIIHNCRQSGNYLELIEQYKPEGAASLVKLREKQSRETNGNIF
ncbi:MAG: hypothetical protein IJ763_04595 [Lachnospiraceae bacterium]|nr:hypothetical protein [Lachnospiraceae bacterium]